MPQTSLLSFFTAPASITIDSEIPSRSTQASPLHPKHNEDVQSNETPLISSKILEKLPLTHPTTSIPRVIVLQHMPKAVIVTIQPSHLPHLKNITSALLPVRYSDKFFNECIQDPNVAEISRVVLYDSKPVGWIRCRFDQDPSSLFGNKDIYIQALGVLAPYRDNGLASALLNEILTCQALIESSLNGIYAHVWEANPDAIEWYERRGFTRVVLLQQYYRRLKPAGAWIVRKTLT